MQTLVELLGAWGVWLVVLNVLADQAGMPVPSYPTLIVATALGPQAGLEMSYVLGGAVGAALVADAGWYFAGVRMGRRVLCRLCGAARAPEVCVSATELAFARFGLPSLLVVKFVPGFSALGAALAGSTRVAPLRYFAVDLVGAVLWASTAVIVGIVFRHVLSEAIELIMALGRYGVLLAAGVAGSVVLLFGYRRWRRMHSRRDAFPVR